MASKKAKVSPLVPTLDGLIRAIADGLTGYMTFEARSGASPVYSEHLLYPPVLRIGRSHGWHVICEHKVDVAHKTGRGDHKRIDFLMSVPLSDRRRTAALELKWISRTRVSKKNKSHALKIANDIRKLSLAQEDPGDDFCGYVLFAGVHRLTGGVPVRKTWKVLPALRWQDRKRLRLVYQVVFRGERTSYGVTVAQLVGK